MLSADLDEHRRRSGNPGRADSDSSVVDAGARILDQMQRSASHTSPTLCGGMLVAMPTAMPAAPLASRFGKARRQHHRLFLLAVIGRAEIDRVLVDAVEQRRRDRGQARFGVAHGRGVIAVDIAEIALAVDQRIALREILRQAHQAS